MRNRNKLIRLFVLLVAAVMLLSGCTASAAGKKNRNRKPFLQNYKLIDLVHCCVIFPHIPVHNLPECMHNCIVL